jgi:hypothetical protein
MGVVAHEVEAAFPELVQEFGDRQLKGRRLQRPGGGGLGLVRPMPQTNYCYRQFALYGMIPFLRLYRNPEI